MTNRIAALAKFHASMATSIGNAAQFSEALLAEEKPMRQITPQDIQRAFEDGEMYGRAAQKHEMLQRLAHAHRLAPVEPRGHGRMPEWQAWAAIVGSCAVWVAGGLAVLWAVRS